MGGRDRQKKKQALCREPDVGLDPGSRSWIRPREEGGAKQLTHPGCPVLSFLWDKFPAVNLISQKVYVSFILVGAAGLLPKRLNSSYFFQQCRKISR